MKKTVITLLTLFSMASWAAASERRDADLDRIQTASTVLSQIMSAPDRAIPDSIMDGAKCIAIMPSMLKASFVFGANYGKGVATCRTATGWSAPAFFKLTGGSFGFQAGGQASDLVLIIRTDEGMQHMLQSKFKLGADASASAGPVGRDAQAMTDLTLRAQVLTYSRSRGLFLGVSLSGGVIKQDQADTQAFYGKDWTFYSVLNGKVPPPADSEVLLNMVERYAPTPKPKAPLAATAPMATPAAAPMTAEAAAPATNGDSEPAMDMPATGTMPAATAAPVTVQAASTGVTAPTTAAPVMAPAPTAYATPASSAAAPVAAPAAAPVQNPTNAPIPASGATGGR
jgi:SH3 domain-containing YSC84-like protein 1